MKQSVTEMENIRQNVTNKKENLIMYTWENFMGPGISLAQFLGHDSLLDKTGV